MAATLGTTSTPWIVALFGLRFRITAFALPSVGVGALWIIGRGRTRSLGAILAGFGLLFTGIDYARAAVRSHWKMSPISERPLRPPAWVSTRSHGPTMRSITRGVWPNRCEPLSPEGSPQLPRPEPESRAQARVVLAIGSDINSALIS
jgi:Na+/Pi-cotransporter